MSLWIQAGIGIAAGYVMWKYVVEPKIIEGPEGSVLAGPIEANAFGRGRGRGLRRKRGLPCPVGRRGRP